MTEITQEMNDPQWQPYAVHTMRLKVPGGYLYHCQDLTGGAASMCFVPDPDKCELHNQYTMNCCQECLNDDQCLHDETTLILQAGKNHIVCNKCEKEIPITIKNVSC